MADPIILTVDAALEIEGREDTVQLAVQGHVTQNAALQSWEDESGTPVAQMQGDGRLEVNLLDLDEQGSTPGNPASGQVHLYAKDDGKVYAKDSAGSERELTGGGTNIVTGTAGEALAYKDYVYHDSSDNEWYKVDIDASPPKVSSKRGVVLESSGIAADASGEIQTEGPCALFSGQTPGADVWADSTAGGMTETKPTLTLDGSQIALVKVGWVLDATTIVLEKQPVQYMKRASLDDDETLTLEHQADPPAQQRAVRALVSDNTTATTTVSTNKSGGIWFGSIGDDIYIGAQSFQVSAGALLQIRFYFGSKEGSPGGVTWEIQTDNSGEPSGTVLDSGSVDSGDVEIAQETVVDVVDGAQLSASTTYWLVLKLSSPPGGTNYYTWQGQDTSSYANGNAGQFVDDGSTVTWYPASQIDVECVITVEVTRFEGPLSVGSWTVGSPDIACRYDDGSDDDPDTKTTIQNLTGAAIDLTLVVEVP